MELLPISAFLDTYGIGITYSGKGGAFKIGSTTYHTQAGSLCTIGPGIVSQWMGEYDAIHDTIYFTEELVNAISDWVPSSFITGRSPAPGGGRAKKTSFISNSAFSEGPRRRLRPALLRQPPGDTLPS